MKVNFLVMNGYDLSGGNRVIALHADYLRRQGHEVRLFAPAPRQETLREKIRRFRRGGGWRQPPPAENHFTSVGLNIEFLESHRPIVSEDLPDADIVIATWWLTAEWMTELEASKGTKVHFIQGYEIFPYLPVERVKEVYNKPFYKIVVSKFILNFMRNRHQADQIALVPNGVDTGVFKPPTVRGRNSLFTLGFLHSNTPVKNMALVSSIIDRVRDADPSIRTRAFGAAHPRLAKDLPEGVDYETQPPQSRIPEIYASCDAWLFTSTSEGFGLPILEAMACGTPVLATSAGAAPELLAEGGGRLLPADPEAFVDALLALRDAPEETWMEMSAQARAIAERHDWARSHELFEAALEDALARTC